MRFKHIVLASILLFSTAVFHACSSAAVSVTDTPERVANAAPIVPIIVEYVTPDPTPTHTPLPTPSPEPTGRSLRAWQLQQIQRQWLKEHPPTNGDIEGTLANMVIDPEKKLIALTFDDGPSNKNTNRILDVLELHHSRATFFVIGKRIEDRKEVIKRAISLGCEIGNHTWGHSDFSKYPKSALIDSLKKTDNAMVSNFNYHMSLFRPPYGSINKDVESGSNDMGYKMILWSGSSHDWSIKNADKIYRNTFDNAADGAIILFHDIYDITADAIERIVPELIFQGYQLVTVSELIAMDETPFSPGDRYGGWAKRASDE
jgi:peptidoglycan/xylan/chitin deacetylase (PgdA/CDA1 family)